MGQANNLDSMCKTVIEKCGINGAPPWFMMASLLYYHCDVSLLSDALYDQLAKDIHAEWDKITHPHKFIIGQDALKAGSAYHLAVENYPKSVRGAAFSAITGKNYQVDEATKDSIYRTRFLPPEYCWDTYVYGNDGLTWRQHQAQTLKKLDDKLARGEITAIERYTEAASVGLTLEPVVRVRQRVRPPEQLTA